MDNKRDFFAEELSLIRTEYIKKFIVSTICLIISSV